MRAMGLFNMSYGSAGLLSSTFLHRVDGSAVSMWVLVLGAASFLGLAPSPRSLLHALLGTAPAA